MAEVTLPIFLKLKFLIKLDFPEASISPWNLCDDDKFLTSSISDNNSLILKSFSLLSFSNISFIISLSRISFSFSISNSRTRTISCSVSAFLAKISSSKEGTMAADSRRSFCSMSWVLRRDSRSRRSSTILRSSETSGGLGWTWAEERGN